MRVHESTPFQYLTVTQTPTFQNPVSWPDTLYENNSNIDVDQLQAGLNMINVVH